MEHLSAWKPSLLWVLVPPLCCKNWESAERQALCRAAVEVLATMQSRCHLNRFINLWATGRSDFVEDADCALTFVGTSKGKRQRFSAEETALYSNLAEAYIKMYKLRNDADPPALVALLRGEDDEDTMYFAPANGVYDGITAAILLHFLVRSLQSHARGAGRLDHGACLRDPVDAVKQSLIRFPVDGSGDIHELGHLDYEAVARAVIQGRDDRPYADMPLSTVEETIAADMQRLEGGRKLPLRAGPIGIGCALLVKLMRSFAA